MSGLVPQLRSMQAGLSYDGAAYDGAAVITVVNRRGRSVQMQLRCTLLRDQDGSAQGVILVMNETSGEPPTAEVDGRPTRLG
jgi:hypothetical protein